MCLPFIWCLAACRWTVSLLSRMYCLERTRSVLPCSHMLTSCSSQLSLWYWMRFIGNDPTEEHTKHKLISPCYILSQVVVNCFFTCIWGFCMHMSDYTSKIDYWTLLFSIMPTFTVLCINLLFLWVLRAVLWFRWLVCMMEPELSVFRKECTDLFGLRWPAHGPLKWPNQLIRPF